MNLIVFPLTFIQDVPNRKTMPLLNNFNLHSYEPPSHLPYTKSIGEAQKVMLTN